MRDFPTPVPSVLRAAYAHAGAAIFKDGGPLVVWGDDSEGQIADAPAGERFGAIATGGAKQGLVIGEDGSLRLWGSASVAQSVPPLPAAVAAGPYVRAHLALTHLLAIRPDGSLLAWGPFYSGGPGPSAAPPAGLLARDAAAGAAHAVAVAMDGTLATWGAGPAAASPPAGRFTAVAARTTYSIALRKDGTLFGWGAVPTAPGAFDAQHGWVSDGAGHFSVPGEHFVALAAGNSHLLALRANGSVAGWGRDVLGSTLAPGGIHFTAVAAGNGFSIGLDLHGALHHWGDPANGLAAVPAGRFVAIGAGARHAAALRAAEHPPS
jgi:hypothetical protein